MWRTNITNYSEVRYSDVYPGIDLVYYGNNGQLEYDLFVAPGADPHTIRLEIENGNPKFGKRQPRINADGDLVIETEAGEFRFRKPVVYQVPLTVVGRRSKATDNRPRKSANNLSSMSNRQFVDGRFELRVLKLDNHDSKTANPSSETENLKYQVSFEIASYDPELPLVIDPVLTYSTFLGGGGSDRGNAITVDANGNAYIAGTTYSSDFPTANAFQATSPNVYKFQPDAFVAKLDPSGTTLLYSTYLGGSYADEAHGIAVDTAGNTYITGITSSKDFPVLGGFQSTHSGGYYDAFVTKLNPTGSAIVYSTYLGGSGDDEAQAIALDSSGSAYVAGFTGSEDFPTTVGAFQRSYQKNQDAFVAKLNTTGSALVYSTYLGGARADSAYGLALDAQGNAYVTGGTTSVDFPATPGAFQTGYSGYFNTGFVAKLNPTGTALVFSSHLGGTNGVGGIAVDASGSAYVTGSANPAFPTSNAFQNKVAGGLYEDAFVTKFHPAGCALVYSTFLGGTYYDKGLAIAVDSGGRAYVAGYTASTDFPLANPIQSDYLGGRAFVAEFTPSGNAILFSTYYGGAPPSYYYGFQPVNGIAVDSQGNVFVTGQTVSEEFPTLGGAQAVYGGRGDAFVAKISPLDASAVSLTRSNLSFGDQPVNSTSPSQTVLLRNMGSAALAITTIEVSGEFAQTNTCGNSVTGGTSCSISITFNPTSAGGKTGTVAISDNASGSPHLITLSGNGIDAPYGALSTSNLDFGTVIQGTTVPPKTVTLTNSGNRTLNVATIELANRTTAGVFTQTNNCATTLPPGASCTISVTLNAAGVSGGGDSSITISDDAPNSPQVNYLLAIVVRPPKARLEGVGVQVDSVVVGNTYPIGSAILANDGDLPLIISCITTSQDFTQDNPCPSSLAPQSYCQILLSFAPKGWGLQNGALTVTDNAADSPQNLALSGRGLDFTVSVSPASATVTAGQSASYTLTVAPLGGFDQAVSLGCSGTPSKATCSITPSYVTPDGTNVVTAAVTVPTSARSTVSPKLRKLPIGPWIGSGRRLLVYLLWLVVLGIVAIWPTPRRKCRPTAWLSLAGAVLVLLSWTSCGGGGRGGGMGGGSGRGRGEILGGARVLKKKKKVCTKVGNMT